MTTTSITGHTTVIQEAIQEIIQDTQTMIATQQETIEECQCFSMTS